MTTIHQSTEVPYTAEQMYALVNDVESYPDYLPWCTQAKILQPGTHTLTATISLQSGKIKQSFTTANIMKPGALIELKLVKGPFKSFSGSWCFENLGESRSRVTIDISFQFKNRILKLAMNSIFSRIINSLIGAFSERAKQLYD